MVDEEAIFAAVAEQRRTVAEACAASKAARRSAARIAKARRMPVTPTALDRQVPPDHMWHPLSRRRPACRY
ncbi:hypothetical protein JMJ56_14385 [Belnapia sp. T18]|uniref:Uncharacterized protein n=1 Tax=Belnapia arida TaxID=2804533 RepID=A0ABS1U3F3_9PROT|nr:hypothetical protein [Belnapia arida]MBL6079203.1 hypothetical protein [Belnapia arida]